MTDDRDPAPRVWTLPPPESPNPEDLPEPAIAPDAAMRMLPGARSLVAAGFDLLREARRDLTRASLYFGLLTLLTLGPAVVLLIYFVTQSPDLFTEYIGLEPTDVPPEPPTGLVMVLLALFCALPALIAISIDAELMAVSILAGHRVGRPVSMDEALRRSRQTFWRTLLSGFVIGGLSFGILLALEEAVGATAMASAEISTSVSVVLGIGFGLPFAYAIAGIVLGDAGPIQTLGRSLRLARARPMLALVIALFATLVGVINTFALAAGGDTLVRIAELLHLDFQSGALLTILSVVVILAGVVAIGSLLFTISAVTTAPQVVAFLGLTHFSEGLDLGRLAPPAPPPPQPPATPAPVTEPVAEAADESAESAAPSPPVPPVPTVTAWELAATAAAAKEASTRPTLVTWPMFILAVLAGLFAVVGFADLAGF